MYRTGLLAFALAAALVPAAVPAAVVHSLALDLAAAQGEISRQGRDHDYKMRYRAFNFYEQWYFGVSPGYYVDESGVYRDAPAYFGDTPAKYLLTQYFFTDYAVAPSSLTLSAPIAPLTLTVGDAVDFSVAPSAALTAPETPGFLSDYDRVYSSGTPAASVRVSLGVAGHGGGLLTGEIAQQVETTHDGGGRRVAQDAAFSANGWNELPLAEATLTEDGVIDSLVSHTLFAAAGSSQTLTFDRVILHIVAETIALPNAFGAPMTVDRCVSVYGEMANGPYCARTLDWGFRTNIALIPLGPTAPFSLAALAAVALLARRRRAARPAAQ